MISLKIASLFLELPEINRLISFLRTPLKDLRHTMEHQILQPDRSIEEVMRRSFISSNPKQTEGNKQSTNHSFHRCQLSLPNLLSVISSSNTPSSNYCSRRTSSIRDDKWASQLITMGLFSRM